MITFLSGNSAQAKGIETWKDKTVYTKVNLRFEFAKNQYTHYSTNFLKYPTLVPVGNPFTVKEVDSDKSLTLSNAAGESYIMNYVAKHTKIPFGDYFDQLLSLQKTPLEKLSKLDQEGITEGIIKPGMTRQGVFRAAGYPPASLNPSFQGNQLVYQYSRFARLTVSFSGEKVDSVEGYPKPEFNIEGKTVYNQFPLRGNFKDDEFIVYSTNYIEHAQFFPINTAFEVTDHDGDQLEMTHKEKKWKVVLEYRAEHNQMPFENFLKDMFSKTKWTTPVSFSKQDLNLISQGRYEPGMSRRALFYAVGKPPRNLNADFEGKELIYMTTIGRKKIFSFNGDKLETVK